MESSFQTQQEPDTKEDSSGDTREPKVQGQPCLFTNSETVSKQTNKEWERRHTFNPSTRMAEASAFLQTSLVQGQSELSETSPKNKQTNRKGHSFPRTWDRVHFEFFLYLLQATKSTQQQQLQYKHNYSTEAQ